MEFFSLTGDEGSFGKLDCLYAMKKRFQLKNRRFIIGFRGGPILRLPHL